MIVERLFDMIFIDVSQWAGLSPNNNKGTIWVSKQARL